MGKRPFNDGRSPVNISQQTARSRYLTRSKERSRVKIPISPNKNKNTCHGLTRFSLKLRYAQFKHMREVS